MKFPDIRKEKMYSVILSEISVLHSFSKSSTCNLTYIKASFTLKFRSARAVNVMNVYRILKQSAIMHA